MKETSSLRIGITIGLSHATETVWNNGIKQNAVFLAEALKHSPCVQSVHLVNTTSIELNDQLPWDRTRWPTVSFEDAKDSLDILIELGGQIGGDQTAYLKERGTYLISYCCGFEYVHAMESVLFNRPSFGRGLFVNPRYDAIWMIPQVANISEHYFSTLRRRPATTIPFVWDPIFLQARSAGFAHGGEYRPHEGPRRISIMEPNINVVKFCLYPIFIVEEAFRKRPDLISFLHVTNAERLANSSDDFFGLMNQLDLVHNHKAAFVGRFETPQFLSEMTDAVVSHQWENPLNYFYLEVCWQGYPLIHNAHLCPDLGYYYHANDVQDGCKKLISALEGHDNVWEAYRDRQRSLISRYLPSNPAVVGAYSELLARLVSQPVV